MKVKNITDVKKFMETVCSSKGSVQMVTSAGDRINLKSTVCQYLSLTEMFKDARVDDVELIIEDPEDAAKLLDFLIRG